MTRPPGRVLVMGATGMLGHVAVEILSRDFDVTGSVRNVHAAARLGVATKLVSFEVGRDDPVELLERVAPEAVVNAIGLVKQLPMGQSPEHAIRLNALLPHEIARACDIVGARLVHVSTDCVFSGGLPAPACYSEDDVSDAADVYGRSKLLGELTQPPHITLRTSMIGRELERASGLMEWFAGQDGGQVRGFTDARFSGFTTRELSRLVARVLRDHPSLTGLWHVAAEPIDKFTLLQRLRGVLGIECEVAPCGEPVINRALDASRFARATGYRPPSWDEMLREYAHD